jgi:hypothetical protein
MSSESKRLLSKIQDPHERGETKRLIIQADMHYQSRSRVRSGREIKSGETDTE